MKHVTILPVALASLTSFASAQEPPSVEIQSTEIKPGANPRGEARNWGDIDMPPELRRRVEESMRRDRAGKGFGFTLTPEAQPHRKSDWRIGVMVEPVDDLLRTHLEIPKGAGVRVTKVVEDSPAAKAGLKENDIILSAGDQPIGSVEALRSAVAAVPGSGRPLALSVIHEGNRRMITIAAPQMPKPQVERPRAHMDGPPAAPAPDQSRRIEEMSAQMQRLRAQLEKQHRRIEDLEKRLNERTRKTAPETDAPSGKDDQQE